MNHFILKVIDKYTYITLLKRKYPTLKSTKKLLSQRSLLDATTLFSEAMCVEANRKLI